MKIYIVRHGESKSNAAKYVAFSHTGLTDKGKEDAHKLGQRLSKEAVKIDIIYCSSLYRALQTLEEILNAGLEIDPKKIIISDLVREINRREFEGKNSEEYKVARVASGIDPNDFKCANGESENDVKKRAEKFLEQLFAGANKDDNVLLISHGHFIGQLVSLLGLGDLGHNHGAALSVIEIDPESKRGKVIFWNDTSHIN